MADYRSQIKGCQISNLPSKIAGVQLHNKINIVLLGKTGVGKSSSGNTILGENKFSCKRSLKSVTQSCEVGESNVEGRHVSVVDTPGFFDTTLSEEELAKEIAWSVFLSAPGVHAFFFVLPVDRFTEQEEEILEEIKMMFGEGVLKYLLLLYTHGDDIDPEEFKSEINGHEKLRKIVERCQGYHIFNNRDVNNRDQVNDLLQKIDTMIEQNGGGHYSNQMYKDAQRFKQEEENRTEQKKCRCIGCSCHCEFKHFWQEFKDWFIIIARTMKRYRNKYRQL